MDTLLDREDLVLYRDAVRDWLHLVMSGDVVRFEKIDGLIEYFRGRWRTSYGRVCATRNRFLFFGNAMIIYSGKRVFTPVDYLGPNRLWFEIEYYDDRVLDPLYGAEEVVIYSNKVNEDRAYMLAKLCERSGVKVRVEPVTKEFAHCASFLFAIGVSLHRIGYLIDTRFVRLSTGQEMPLGVYIACSLVAEAMGLVSVPAHISRQTNRDNFSLVELVENDMDTFLENYRASFKSLAGVNPSSKYMLMARRNYRFLMNGWILV